MRRSVLTALFIAVAILGTTTADAQPSAALFRHIPADADGVYELNLDSIFSKLDYHALFAAVANAAPVQQEQQVLDDVQTALESGVDLHSHAVISQSYQNVPDSPKYIAMLIPLIDSGRFMTFIRTHIHPLHPPYPNPGHARVLISSSVGIAWDAKLAVFVFRIPNQHSGRSYNIAVLQDINTRRTLAAFHGSTTSYFATDPIFIKACSDNADAHIWNRHSAGYSTLRSALQHITTDSRLQLIGDLVKASREHTIGTVRAEGNKLTYTHLRLTTPAENAALKRIINPPLSSTILASVPAGRLIGLATLHFDPRASMDSLSHLGIMDSLLFHLQQQGLTARDLTDATGGDLLLLAYLDDPFPSTTDQASPAFFLVGTVKDSAAFIRIAGQLHLTDAAIPLTRDTIFKRPFNFYGIHDGLGVISTTPNMTRGYFDHLKMSDDLTAKLSSPSITQSAFSLELDLHAYAEMILNQINDNTTEDARAKANIMSQFESLSISTGFVRDDGIETKYELATADRKNNVLTTLLKFAVESYKIQHNR